MKKIDMFLLNKAQAISDWFQIYFGITNFTIARWCVVLTASNLVYLLIILKIYILALIVLFVCVILFRKISLDEKNLLDNPGMANSAAVTDQSSRPVFVIIVLLLWVIIGISWIFDKLDNSKTFITGSAGLTFATIMMYFMACTPRPLTKSKVRKLFESIRLLPKPVTA